MRSVADAWSTLNPDHAAPFYAQDADLVFFDIPPTESHGFAEYKASAVNLFSRFQSMKFIVNDDAQVRVTAESAFGTANCRLELLTKENKPVAMNARWTLVWEKRGAQWLIVHEHLSIPMR
jgi:ketosteroid isomerase-like protein